MKIRSRLVVCELPSTMAKESFKKLLPWFLSLLVCLVALSWAKSASCRQKETGNDVVILLDSSGSMKKTDPKSLRVPAAKLFISLLNKHDRVSVVSFDEERRLLCDFTPVDTKKNRDKLSAAVEKVTSSGRYTDLHAALEKGIELFSQKRKKSGRSMVLLLMTDGKMDVGDPHRDAQLLKGIKKEHIKYLKKNNIRVYSIAFTKHSEMKLLQMISKGSGGFNTFAPTAKDLHRTFTALFESLKTPDMLPVEGDKFLVDGSIDEVTVIAEKSSPETGISLQSPHGDEYTVHKKGEYIKWFASDNFDMITIQEPEAGSWKILFSSGKKDKVYIVTDLKMRSNFHQSYVQIKEAVLIETWLQQFGSTIGRRDILDKIDFYTEITTPAGDPVILKLYDKGRRGDRKRRDGIYTNKYIPREPGAYVATVVAKGKTFERKLNLHFKVMEPVEEEHHEEPSPAHEEPSHDEEESPAHGEPSHDEEEVETTAEESDHPAGDEGGLSVVDILIVFVGANLLIVAGAFGFVKLKAIKKAGKKPVGKKKSKKKKKSEKKRPKEKEPKEEEPAEEEPAEEKPAEENPEGEEEIVLDVDEGS